jgi:hypothetical protein
MTFLKVSRPDFTHEELMILADALSQYQYNQGDDVVESDGANPHIESALEKLMAYQAGVPQPVEMKDVLSSPMLLAGPYDVEVFQSAPPFSVFAGQPSPGFSVGSLVWDMFDISGSEHGDLEEASCKTGLHVLSYNPEADRDASEANGGRDDFDAALAFLKAGGVLCKVPDAPGSPYYRLMSVNVLGAPTSGNAA